MRLTVGWAVLLAVVILFACVIEAASTSENPKTTKPTSLDASQWGRPLSAGAKDAPANRLLRKTSATGEDDEERGFSVVALAKKFGAKMKRLAKYNWWIFSGKKPEQVTDPRYQGYWDFYHNRMTPGGKYH
ncbi:hypothetical protein PHYPSEUDO_003571 [Phytophthora pseudosyringae]|uniref:RxLR effector protein n=1 Tax=Phytophthora pseudosyringae TaxID=221518 RepID=A0A8T1VVI1_9STRA|nr:hypothetical protein PHYPSEUDO_003571 [Phytophthora pseudosyringae]